MGEATPPSHTVPTALDHSPMPAHDGTAHLKPSSASLLESNGKTDGGHPPITSPVTTHGDSAVDEQQVLDQVAMEPPKKRSRDETTENDDASPPLEELLVTPVDREATVEPAFSTTVGRTGATANSHEDGQSVAEPVNVEQPEETTQTMQTIEKVVPKKITVKASRARACAACKKRKVKCKHRVSKGEAGEDAGELLEPARSEEAQESTRKTTLAPIGSVLQTDGTDVNSTLVEADQPAKPKAKKNAAPKKAIAPPERSSTRNRRAPERFEGLQEQLFNPALSTKKGFSKVFDPNYITTNSTSRLGKADMYHMLTNDDTAWRSLSAEQQETLVSMLPGTAETQRLLVRIRAGDTEDTKPQYLKASDVFRAEVAKFQADLKNGHLAKTWQVTAEQAVTERASGQYDAWKANEAELWWGQKGK